MRRAKFLDVWVKRDRLHAIRKLNVAAVQIAVAAAEKAGAIDAVPLGEPSVRAIVDGGGTHLGNAGCQNG